MSFPNIFSRQVKHITSLRGHSGPVISVAFSPNGKLVASGGIDGVKIWDLKTMNEVTVSQQPYNERAQVSCVCWVTRKDETFDTLCYGNGLGFLVFLRHRPTEAGFETVYSTRIATGGEIVCVTADTSTGETTRIATCTRDKCIQVWKYDSGNSKLIPVSSKQYEEQKEVVPKVLAFDENVDQDLLVFGLYDGGLYKYSGKDAKLISKHQLRSQIGNAAVNVEKRICAVDNIEKGFDIYKIDSGNFVKALTTRDPLRTYPKGVVFADRCRLVIGGSDHGCVYVFERKTGNTLKVLQHSKYGGVETIAAKDNDDESVFIASASATSSGPTSVELWKWKSSGKGDGWKENDREGLSAGRVLENLMKLVIVIAAIAYVLQTTQIYFQGIVPKGVVNVLNDFIASSKPGIVRTSQESEVSAMAFATPIKRVGGPTINLPMPLSAKKDPISSGSPVQMDNSAVFEDEVVETGTQLKGASLGGGEAQRVALMDQVDKTYGSDVIIGDVE